MRRQEYNNLPIGARVWVSFNGDHRSAFVIAKKDGKILVRAECGKGRRGGTLERWAKHRSVQYHTWYYQPPSVNTNSAP